MGFRRFAAFGPVLLANPYFLYNIRVTLKYTIPNITYSTSLSTFYPKRVDPDDPIVTRISQDPKLMASIQEFSEILKSKGIDLGKRQMPSMLQMAKLATDGQVEMLVWVLFAFYWCEFDTFLLDKERLQKALVSMR
ncbi:12831_t:CDS:2 [Entrophospora sp. SA101]|nr:12831_t:CDS:2 [Entrophospora sp. SA101]